MEKLKVMTSNQNKAKKYAEQSIHYFSNALESFKSNEYEKAGELLWGSVAQIIKAVAASKGKTLKKHTVLWTFVENLTEELKDRSIYDTFAQANHLHSNFYEVELPPEHISRQIDQIKALIYKMLGLLNLKELVEPATPKGNVTF